MSKTINSTFTKSISKNQNRFAIDWLLLIFLLLITQNRFFALKIVAIIGISVLRPAFKYLKEKNITRFYGVMILLSLAQYLFVIRDYSGSYMWVFIYSLSEWILLLLVSLQFYRFAFKDGSNHLFNTLNVFFWIDAMITLINLVAVMWHTKTINPYEHAAEPLYGMSTGDHLSGYFGFHLYDFNIGDYSTINSAVLPMFFLFFFFRKKWLNVFIALLLLVLTTSNLINIFVLALLLLIALFENRGKYLIPAFASIVLIAGLYAVITPKNYRYVRDKVVSKVFQSHTSTPAKQSKPVSSGGAVHVRTNVPYNVENGIGKVYSFKETAQFLIQSPSNFIWGAGQGRFSGLLAAIAADTSPSKGRVFRKLTFHSETYHNNHGNIAETIRKLPAEYHSVMNHPAAWYNQILGEYGILGLITFLFFYVLYFIKNGWKGYGKYFIIYMSFVCFFEYVFDTFSIMFVFEVIMIFHVISLKTPEKKKVEHLPV